MRRIKDIAAKVAKLYALLGPLKRQFWASILLLLGQAAWAAVILAAMASFFQSLTQAGLLAQTAAAPQPLMELLQRLVAPIPPEQRAVWGFVLATAALVVGSLLETFVQARVTFFSTSFICDLRERVFDRLLRNSQTFHDSQQKGALLQMLMPEVRSCYSLFKTLFNVVIDLLQSAVYAVFAAALSLKLSLLVLCFGVVWVAVNRLFARAVARISQKALKARERLMIAAEESLGGVKQVKLLNLFGPSHSNFAVHNRESEFSNRDIAMLMQWQDAAGTFIGALALAGLVAVALRYSLLGLSSLLLFLYVMNQLLGSLKGAMSRYTLFASSLPSVDRITGFLEESLVHEEKSGALTRAQLIEDRLVFEGVGLDYGPKKGVLRGIDLVVKRGQTVALVGASGAGKTSLGSLVVRLYDCTQGRILIDGTPIEELDLAWLRGRIGIVNQEPLLFNLTARQNIKMARPEASDAEVEAAAKEAYAHEFITQLPQGYDTPVGDRGVKLSGGQKQRVHIAQLFLKDPELLILDEATSALDSQSEELVQAALMRLAKERTTLVIAHRLSTVRSADQIVVLSAGRIAESGTWAELMEREGLFYDMVRRQVLTPAASEAA